MAGLFTLFTLGFRRGGATGLVSAGDGGVFLASSFTSSAATSGMVDGRGAWEGGGGGGCRRGLWGSIPLAVVRRFLRCLATGCRPPSLVEVNVRPMGGGVACEVVTCAGSLGDGDGWA